jgi:lysophospholipase L1-like esterase
LIFDKNLGWLLSYPHHVRTNRNISVQAEAGKFRVLSFGDSFTHGDGVNAEEAFPELLNAMDERIDSLNLGVSRFGLDQEYLMYLQHGDQFKPDLVLICFMPENILRHVNVFRPFYAYGDAPPLTKPRFYVDAGKLKLIPNPFQKVTDYSALLENEDYTLQRIGKHDFFFKNYKWDNSWQMTPGLRLLNHIYYTSKKKIRLKQILTKWTYRENSEALSITIELMKAFDAKVKEQGAKPVIVIVPRYQDLWVYVRKGNEYYEPLLEQLKKNELNYLDGHDAFSPLLKRNITETEFEDFKKKYFNPGEHYSAEGHKVFAEFLYSSLIKDAVTAQR